jgi:hypothetical protein
MASFDSVFHTDPDQTLDAVERHFGKQGALYLAHLKGSSTNGLLTSVIQEIEQNALRAEGGHR